MRNRGTAAILATTLLAILVGLVPASARQAEEDLHSDNMKMLARKPIKIDKDLFAQGSDLAFSGKLIVAGSYQGTAFYKITKRRPFIKQVGFHQCPGSQGDVSILGKYVFVSIDAASTNTGTGPLCNNTKTNLSDNSNGKEGVRIIDISNLEQPKQVAFVEMDCGSHTHTLVPGDEKITMYVESYPLGAPTATCSPASHRKVSIFQFDADNPTKYEMLDPLDVSPSIGCHDLTTFPEKNLAVAACISESQVWDITDPGAPVILSVINNPAINIHHSSSFTWDGKYIILSDEYSGASGGGCAGNKDSTIGAMWFYDIQDPAVPVLKGSYSLPRVPPADTEDEAARLRCTTHLYNIIPMKDPTKYIAASSYYAGGISVVDFSDPAAPEELAFYIPLPGGVIPDMWAAYWYNGRIYANNHSATSHGIEVFRLKTYGKKSNVHYFQGDYNPQIQISRFK